MLDFHAILIFLASRQKGGPLVMHTLDTYHLIFKGKQVFTLHLREEEDGEKGYRVHQMAVEESNSNRR